MKVYIVTNKAGLLIGAYREFKIAEDYVTEYVDSCVTTEPDIYIWELTTEQVGIPINTKYKCLKIVKT
jgi:hypothetical protein